MKELWGVVAFCCVGVAVGAAFVLRKRILATKPTKLSFDARDGKNAERSFQDVSVLIRNGAVTTVSSMVILLRGESPKKITVIPELVAVAQREVDKGLIGAEGALWSQLIWKARQLTALESRRRTAFSEEDNSHVTELELLWKRAFGNTVPFERRSEKWGELGFQGLDPTTDFRGGGMLALDHFSSFAASHPKELQQMIAFNEAQQSDGETSWYLTAVVSIQFTVQLMHEKDHPFYLRHLAALYDGTDRNGKDGMTELHHQLMLHFMKMWHKDKPHVMEYNTYMPKVFGSFFSP